MARRHVLLPALIGAVAALALAGPAEASHGCGASRSKGAELVVKTREAVVFTKGPYVYGCLSSAGTVRRLIDEGGGIRVSGTGAPQLAGRYVAYATFGSAIGDESDRVYVYDLKLGRPFVVESSTAVTDIALKRNGSVAWVEVSTVDAGEGDPVFDVRRWSGVDRQGAVLLDRGPDVGRGSLVLSDDRRTISWTLRDGSVRSAPLN